MATLGYDLAGRINSVTDAAGTHTQSYFDGQRAVESHTSGVLHGESVTRSYDSLGRLQTVALPGGKSISYTYNASGALAGVTTAGGATGSWSNFSPATGKAGNFALGSQSAGIVYDGLGRLLSYGSAAIAAINPYAYTYDADGHCSGSSTPNGVWTYVYNANGWLHSAAAPGWKSFTYNFDEAGRPAGAVDYRPMVRLNNAVAEVMGSVTPGATLTINGVQEPVSAGGVFDVSFTGLPTGWQTFTVQGSLAGAGANGSAAAAADTFHVYVPPLSESLGYDASGNRGSDSHWAQTWNALDQLTTVIESNPYSTGTSTRLDCIYDVSGRRVQKQVSVGGQVTKRTTTLWDGWLPMMEIDYGASGLEIARRYYTWGPDVSGSLDGAAGIGGLIEIYEIKPTGATRSLPVQDGIGNVVGLVDETTGQSVATYQYGPFGEVVGVYGPRAESCPLRFQTKLYDEETGFYYFGKRYYDPKTQTWLSRDPERESGGINLYAYCGNDPIGQCDPLGLAMFGYFDSYSEYFSEVGQTYANIGLGAYQAVKGAGLGTIQLIDQTPANLFEIGSSFEEMSQDPKLYLSAAYDLLKESPSDAKHGLLNLGEQTADIWTSGDLAQQGQFVGGALGNAALLAAPFAKLPAVGDIYATVKSAYTGNSWLSSETGALNPSGHLFRSLGNQTVPVIEEIGKLGAAEGTVATTWQGYEQAIQNIYGGPASFSSRQYQAVVDGQLVNGVADNVTTIGGNSVAVEAKFVNNWATSIRNPASPVGNLPFAIDSQTQVLSQAKAYSNAFDQVIYHSNNPEFIRHYSNVFQDAGIFNLQFILTK